MILNSMDKDLEEAKEKLKNNNIPKTDAKDEKKEENIANVTVNSSKNGNEISKSEKDAEVNNVSGGNLDDVIKEVRHEREEAPSQENPSDLTQTADIKKDASTVSGVAEKTLNEKIISEEKNEESLINPYSIAESSSGEAKNENTGQNEDIKKETLESPIENSPVDVAGNNFEKQNDMTINSDVSESNDIPVYKQALEETSVEDTDKNIGNPPSFSGKKGFNSKKLVVMFCAILFISVSAYFLYDRYYLSPANEQEDLTEESSLPSQSTAPSQEEDYVDNSSSQEDEDYVMPESEYLVDEEVELEKKNNDSGRLEKLANFSDYLVRYSFQNNVDFPISAQYIKLNEDNYISELVFSLSGEESSDYLLDLKDPEFYFAYKSIDGKSFEFTARMESEEDYDCDPEALKDKDICVYRFIVDEETANNMKKIIK